MIEKHSTPEFWKQQRVVVTGGGGFLGSFIVDQIEALEPAILMAVRSRDYDLRKEESIDRLLSVTRPTLIIHAAAASGGIGANRQAPGQFFYDNIMMGVQLMEMARVAGVPKVVQVGSVCAYPKFTPAPFREEDIWNGYPEETNAPYGLAKKMLLVQAQAYRAQYQFNAVHLLLANLYGPRDNFDLETSHAIPALIRKALEAREQNGPIDVWGTGKATRDWLYVEDAARAILLAAEYYNSSEPVNVGTGSDISMRDLVQEISDVCGFKGPITWNTSRPDGQPKRILDVSRAEASFGFKSRVSLKEGLQKTLDWYLEHAATPA